MVLVLVNSMRLMRFDLSDRVEMFSEEGELLGASDIELNEKSKKTLD